MLMSRHKLHKTVVMSIILEQSLTTICTGHTLSKHILCFLFQLVIQLSPSADRKEYYLKQLNKGPALVLFLPLKLYMDKVNQHLLEVVSTIYTSPAEKGWYH